MEVRIGATVTLPHSTSLPIVRRAERHTTIAVWDYAEQESYAIKAHIMARGLLHLPRQYGLSLVRENGLSVVLDVAEGKPLRDYPEIALRDYQEPWVDEIVRKFDKDLDIVATAATGKGKTVMALEVARRLGRATLVVVDQEFLRDQWIERAKSFWGISRTKVGLVQGQTCEYEGKDLVVGMIQSLYNRHYGDAFYRHFGTVIFDEVHTAGAEQFSNTLMQFPARYRLGITATLRKDAMQQLIDLNLGPSKVSLGEEHRRSVVRYLEHPGVVSWYANISPKAGRFISELADDTVRNFLIAEAIRRLHETGRATLAVSDRIEHLENLLAICAHLGIPQEDMGIISGYRLEWRYVKDPTPPRKPPGLQKGAEYCPVKLKLTSRRMPRTLMKEIKDTKRVIFATYGMFNKGVDLPRLAAGIDCTPRAKAQQVHGRILRVEDGKLVPIWVTIRDIMSYKAEYQFAARIQEYLKSNAGIEQWHFEKGIRQRDPGKLLAEARNRTETLKSLRIQTGPDGNNTVLTSSIVRK